MPLQLATIAGNIAALSISGVTIKDFDEIPSSVSVRDTNILMPDPNGFVTSFSVKIQSFGSSAQRCYTVTYDLNYLLIASPVGAGRVGTLDWYSGMYTTAAAIIDALLATDVGGAADLTIKTMTKPVGITDAAGNRMNGIYITFTVTELVN